MTPNREKLIELRFTKGMTREDIADHFEVSIATVRRWIKDLNVPRPTRSKPSKRDKSLSPSGEIIAKLDPDERYTSLEVAQMRLGGRLIEVKGFGYYLDGRPARIDAILEAAGVVPS
jgi:transposase